MPQPQPIGVDPTVPTDVVVPADQLDALLAAPILQPAGDPAMGPTDGTVATGWNQLQIFDDGRSGVRETMPSVFLGAAILFIAGWWLASGRAGAGLQPLAVPLAVATAVPFILRPLEATWSPPLVAIGGVLLALAMVPLAAGLHDRIADAQERRLVAQAIARMSHRRDRCGHRLAFTEPWSGSGVARWALVGAIPLIPGLLPPGPIQPGGLFGAATSSRPPPRVDRVRDRRRDPARRLGHRHESVPLPIRALDGADPRRGRFTVRPLARLATRAQLQRDLVVAATEAERARVAADIHDDALQELTLLVQRLDSAGDTEGAEIARTVSDRCGRSAATCDCRSSTTWASGRRSTGSSSASSGWPVARSASSARMAPGRRPMSSSPSSASPRRRWPTRSSTAARRSSSATRRPRRASRSRSTTRAPASSADAGAEAERSGHFGLLNMQQRAEAIGAILDVRRWPTGGTHVALEWRAH